MYLIEMKRQVLNLIEEASTSQDKLTDDPDIAAKLNDVINQIMFELARIKKIPNVREITVSEDKTDLTYRLQALPNFYQLDNIRAKNQKGQPIPVEVFGKNAIFSEPGTAIVKYYKYPERITDETDDTSYEFELSDDALEIMPYGVAGDILKSDISNQYGQIYSNRYQDMMRMLDPRYNTGSIYFKV